MFPNTRQLKVYIQSVHTSLGIPVLYPTARQLGVVEGPTPPALAT